VQDIRVYRQQKRGSRPDASPSQHVSHQAHRFLDRFNAANSSRDGQLTLQQAQAAHMPWVARNFAAIDTQQKGYVTVQDVRSYRQQMRAERSGSDQIIHNRCEPVFFWRHQPVGEVAAAVRAQAPQLDQRHVAAAGCNEDVQVGLMAFVRINPSCAHGASDQPPLGMAGSAARTGARTDQGRNPQRMSQAHRH
jgi:hypothetical protein